MDRARGAALDAIVAVLREAFDVPRCTLRLDVEGDVFPVLHEACTPPAHSLIGDRRVALPGQPVVEALLGGADQVVQPDTRAASSDPAFLAMLELYGGMGAQIGPMRHQIVECGTTGRLLQPVDAAKSAIIQQHDR